MFRDCHHIFVLIDYQGKAHEYRCFSNKKKLKREGRERGRGKGRGREEKYVDNEGILSKPVSPWMVK